MTREYLGAADGSSPRGRGKRVERDDGLAFQRLIPARAGKTRGELRLLRGPAAHPRAGGENAGGGYDAPWMVGSSPRGRGKQSWSHHLALETGLIPARAGKTSSPQTG